MERPRLERVITLDPPDSYRRVFLRTYKYKACRTRLKAIHQAALMEDPHSTIKQNMYSLPLDLHANINATRSDTGCS